MITIIIQFGQFWNAHCLDQFAYVTSQIRLVIVYVYSNLLHRVVASLLSAVHVHVRVQMHSILFSHTEDV